MGGGVAADFEPAQPGAVAWYFGGYSEWLKGLGTVMSADGTIPRSLQEKMIAFQRKSLKVERDVAPENVYDLSIVRSLNEEMRKSK